MATDASSCLLLAESPGWTLWETGNNKFLRVRVTFQKRPPFSLRTIVSWRHCCPDISGQSGLLNATVSLSYISIDTHGEVLDLNMAASSFFLLCLLTLSVSTMAQALECYECTNVPGFPGSSRCDSDSIGKVTCPQFFNRCFTMKYKMSIGDQSIAITTRNCSNSLACDPQSEFNTCKLINSSGLFTSCELACCQGNLCDPYAEKPTSAVSVLAASVVSILVAFILNMFSWLAEAYPFMVLSSCVWGS